MNDDDLETNERDWTGLDCTKKKTLMNYERSFGNINIGRNEKMK